MSKKEIPDFTQNRELSWLRFNQRVLEEARDESVPLMERMKFVAIFTSNLDEFFMIRVGSLYDLAATDDKKIDQRSGMTAKQQLDAIYRAVSPLYKERDKTYAEIKKQLHPYGVCGLDFKELEQQEKKFVKKYFKEEVLPVLSPQIVDANHPFPHLLSKEIYVVANLKQGDKAMLGIIPVPQYIVDVGEVEIPFPMDAIVKKDTIKDTVYINIPIQRKTYSTDDYRAVISGYRPNLDTMIIYHKKEIIYEKSRRWGIGLAAGYGVGREGFSPYLGAVVYYRIW